jgi:hypothetical protein
MFFSKTKKNEGKEWKIRARIELRGQGGKERGKTEKVEKRERLIVLLSLAPPSFLPLSRSPQILYIRKGDVLGSSG